MGGFVARQYADVWHSRCLRKDWLTRVDGIEIFQPYIQPYHAGIYDDIKIGNALDVLPTLGNYDLVICVDVLEHLERAHGEQLLNQIAEHSDAFLVSTPVHFFAQGAVYGNEAETHRELWTPEQLQRWGTVSQNGILLMVER